MIIYTFYNGLLYSTRMTLDVDSGGALMDTPQYITYNLIEEMGKNHHSWGSVRQVTAKSIPKIDGLYEINAFDHMNAKADTFYQKIDILSITPSIPVTPPPVSFVASATLYCDIWGVNKHTDRDCQMILTRGSTQENVNFANNNQRKNPYSNTYNSRW